MVDAPDYTTITATKRKINEETETLQRKRIKVFFLFFLIGKKEYKWEIKGEWMEIMEANGNE